MSLPLPCISGTQIETYFWQCQLSPANLVQRILTQERFHWNGFGCVVGKSTVDFTKREFHSGTQTGSSTGLQDGFDNVAVDVRQAVVAALVFVGQASVVEA